MATIEREELWRDETFAFLRPESKRRPMMYGEYNNRQEAIPQRNYTDDDYQYRRNDYCDEHQRFDAEDDFYETRVSLHRRSHETPNGFDYENFVERRQNPSRASANGRQANGINGNQRSSVPDNYKVTYCKNMPNCPFGEKCTFAHSASELRHRTMPPVPKDYKKILCRDWPNNCVFGERCKYFHPYEIDPYNMQSTATSTKNIFTYTGPQRSTDSTMSSNSAQNRNTNMSILSQLTQREDNNDDDDEEEEEVFRRSRSPSIISVTPSPVESIRSASPHNFNVDREEYEPVEELEAPRTRSPIPMPPPEQTKPKDPPNQSFSSSAVDNWSDEERSSSSGLSELKEAAEVELPPYSLMQSKLKGKIHESASSCVPLTTAESKSTFNGSLSSSAESEIADESPGFESDVDDSTCSQNSTNERLVLTPQVRRSRSVRTAALISNSRAHANRSYYVAVVVLIVSFLLLFYFVDPNTSTSPRSIDDEI
ncbi:hypothetical protein M3Y98_01189400 [Aphelenchoides besseyi]|nr:hypothetical protein M3Y98_01189400 [Aphelenchoides besseyi]KAI6195034.1 hypothetical protein M3Y96_01188300 [Aphelenchoides besseyi]